MEAADKNQIPGDEESDDAEDYLGYLVEKAKEKG
jgi:hypothetical protein